LSNIPSSVCDVIDPSAPVQRLRPLFTIGVHDISYLLEHQAALKRASQADNHDDPINLDDASSGWVACTTDSILAMKDGLWDMLITMPPAYSSNAKQRVWPTVECPKGVPVKATQRDLRRFRSLTIGLSRLAAATSASVHPHPNPASDTRSLRSETSDAVSTPATPAIRLSSSSRPGTATQDPHRHHATRSLSIAGPGASADYAETEAIVEPTTWAALAYNGFMWWASAGEKRHGDEVDEHSHDAALLAGLAPLSPVMAPAVAGGQKKTSFGDSGAESGSLPHDSRGEGMVDSWGQLTPGQRRLGGGDATEGEGDDGEGEEEDERGDDECQARLELAVVAYFHRLTTNVLSVLADIVDSADDDDLLDLGPGLGIGGEFDGEGAGARSVSRASLSEEEGSSEEARLLDTGNSRGWVRVDSDALAQMGLDVWSQADADFVREVTARYFSRRAYVETKGVEICGVRIC
jgi:hypothetical protein